MSRIAHAPEQVFLERRKRLLKLIKGEAALFVSADEKQFSRDVYYPYRQENNLYYLTGICEQDCALLLLGNARGARSILFLRDRDAAQEKWTGERIGIRRAKRWFDVDEVRPIESFDKDIAKLLSHSETLHYITGVNTAMDAFVLRLFQTPIGPRTNFPNCFKDARLLLSEMRFVKDHSEISAIKRAADITGRALLDLAPRLRYLTSERHAAMELEGLFYRRGASGVAFPTIVASGKNATVLHHAPRSNPIWKKELVLFDVGATFHGYASDISRTLPVLGKFSPAQAQVYDVVHIALKAALSKAAPGSTLDRIHSRATSQLTKGLIELGILDGTLSAQLRSQAYKPYYMHRTGHWLGLDVHDISPLGPKNKRISHSYSKPLVPGNVFTVEPGLYLDPNDKTIPEPFRGIGIRIEEDVLITDSGYEVLSTRFPTERADIEALLG